MATPGRTALWVAPFLRVINWMPDSVSLTVMVCYGRLVGYTQNIALFGWTHLLICKTGVLERVNVRQVALSRREFNMSPHETDELTHRLLGEDGTLLEALDDERVVVL